MAQFRHSNRENAVLAWLAVAILLVLAAHFVVTAEHLWGVMAVVVALVGLVPAVLLRDWRSMPPWGLSALTVLPFLLQGYPWLAKPSAYLAIAAVALMITIYLVGFTGLQLTAQFGILVVVTTTFALGTTWAGLRGLADIYYGTSYLGGLGGLERDLLISAIGGVLASIVFEGYFRERTTGELDGTPIEEA